MAGVAATPSLDGEFACFARAAAAADPEALSACEGFTVHDVVAHVVAAAHETSTTLEALYEGRPVPPTREFAEREAPFRAMRSHALLTEMEGAFGRLSAAFEHVLSRDPAATVTSAGVPMPVAGMVTHKRSELSLHRWDVAGDDDVSKELLGQPAITSHAVVLGHLLLARAVRLFGEIGTRFEVALRSPGCDDVLVTVDAGGGRLSVAPPTDRPAVTADPAARLLLLWGRRPADRGRVRSDLSFVDRWRLFTLLRGF